MPEFTPAPIKPIIAFSALEALDIRVGTIERVEDVPKSDKLLKLIVNFGDHTRSILAGMKKAAAEAKRRKVPLSVILPVS